MDWQWCLIQYRLPIPFVNEDHPDSNSLDDVDVYLNEVEQRDREREHLRDQPKHK